MSALHIFIVLTIVFLALSCWLLFSLLETRQQRATWENTAARWTKAFFKNPVSQFFSDLPVTDPKWTQEDAETFRAFLATECGQKFQLYLRAKEILQNRYSIRNFPHEAAMCGEARGYGLCISHIVSLSADVGPQPDINTDAPSLRGEEELRENYTP